ncbi:MAG: type II secretion system protein [bacterium]
MNKLIKQKSNKGFTLVETLVAISILMIAIVAPMTIVQNGLTAAGYAKQQMIADFLAQEALEYVKYTRDINGLADKNTTGAGGTVDNWLSGLNECVSPSYCIIDPVTNKVMINNNEPLYYYDGLYQYNSVGGSAAVTPFTRKLTIVKNYKNEDQAKVTVIVDWTGKNSGQVIIDYYILNWR